MLKLPGGSLNGEFVDATPFASSVEDPNGEWISESESLFDKISSILGCRSMVLTTAVLRAPKKSGKSLEEGITYHYYPM
ncbi:hypothetical protein SAY86_027334 [Trapa natans]|uniref:Uncharacterized protein n=1 Tax=Trapa natans TaxID=22666 RepID=A0AAN7KQL5_TRANT|nr:hypothetical protein SAY86_027334 [Trapa natans]